MADEKAQKHLNYAELAMQDKDYEDAKKSILKSLNCKITEKAYKMLAECEAKLKAAGRRSRKNSNAREPPVMSPSNSMRNGNSDKKEEATTLKSDEPEENKEEMDQKQEEKKTANDEDVAFCEEILKTTNYYEILGVEKTATEEEIKKQYKKLALRLHPDKNRAPQATEAFKKVAQALACLTNPNKRKIYDEHGNEENFRTQYREYFQDEDELDPEDLFDLLFTGRINRNRQRRYGRRAYDPQAQAQNMQRGKYYMLMQILPFLLMMVLTVFMQFKGTPDPGFSLTHNEKYSFKRTIDAFDIDYYVEPKFEETFNTPYKKHELEQEVKKAFAENLYRECVLTRRRKMQLEEAKYYASSQEKISSLDEEIEELDWTSCKKFSEIRDSFALD